MLIAVVGLNHNSATIEQREIFELNRKKLPDYLVSLKAMPEVSEAVILNTCNRLEFYLVLNSEINPFEIIQKFYFDVANIEIDKHRSAFYEFKGTDATKHLYSVISGLDSIVLGEYQIQGQVRDAYSLACKANTVDKVFHKLFHSAFRCGKAVRSETSLGSGKQSIGGVAAGLFVEYCNPADEIAVIGVNENTKIVAEILKKAGFSNFLFVNRTGYKAEIMADEFGGSAYTLDKLVYVLARSRAVFSCTGAPHYIANSLLLQSLVKRNCCPELVVDMAVPRDFNNYGLSDEIKYYDIELLKVYLDNQTKKQEEELPKAWHIIEKEASIFSAWSDFSSNDILKPYAEKFEKTRLEILEEYQTQFSEANFEKIDKLTRKLIHRLQSSFISALSKNNLK